MSALPVLPLDARALRRFALPPVPADGDKEARGRILVIGGARQMPGPIVLAGTAALRAGAGKLQIATVGTVAPHVATAVPEALVHGLPESRTGAFAAAAARPLRAICREVQAIVMGPGMHEDGALAGLVRAVLASVTPAQVVVLDAGALAVLPRAPRTRAPLLLTPHAGEMATLLGAEKAAVKADDLGFATRAARRFRAVTVLKGKETLITDGVTTCRNRAGNVGLATSGSGDTLAGIIAGLAARGASPFAAAVWGVHLHARAGELLARRFGPVGYLARDLATELPGLLAALTPKASAR